MPSKFAPIIQPIAQKYGLDPALVAAFCVVESTDNENAMRFEPAFLEHYVDQEPDFWGNCNQTTERYTRAFSFGPMQIMGEVARELGFQGEYLSELCNPANGIEYGCKLLAQKRDKYLPGFGWDGVIAAYNAGSPRLTNAGKFVNQNYVDKINKAKG